MYNWTCAVQTHIIQGPTIYNETSFHLKKKKEKKRNSVIATAWMNLKGIMLNEIKQKRNCSTPDFPVHHQLPELAQNHVL